MPSAEPNPTPNQQSSPQVFQRPDSPRQACRRADPSEAGHDATRRCVLRGRRARWGGSPSRAGAPVRVAGVARTEPVCSGARAGRSPCVQTPAGIDRRREPQRPMIARQLTSPTRCRIVFGPLHHPQASSSLYRNRAQGRGLEPSTFDRIETRPPGWWGNACRSTAPAPQSKPVTPASRLLAPVAPSVAFGLGLRILAAGPARVRLYSLRAFVWTRPKSLSGLVRRHRLIRPQWPGLASQER